MALYFKERIDEQKKKEEDPLKDKITFTRSWIITVPPPNDAEEIDFREEFGTSYKFGNETWYMKLSTDELRICTLYALYIKESEYVNVWNGSSCFISSNLYYDNNMRFLLYSSTKTQMQKVSNADIFHTPNGFMTKMIEAYCERKIAKIVIFVELQLPTKNFYRPFEMSSCYLRSGLYKEYPNDMDENDKFGFLKNGDYVIRCPDGSILAQRIFLKIFSKFLKKHFETSDDLELPVEHSLDVVQPIIICFHTRYFQMPKSYDFDYAKRLLIATEFFEPECEILIKASIEDRLCKKIVKQYQDFDSILQWTSIASRYSFTWLEIMLATVIADKFYFKWQQTFPENARNSENPLFFALFGGSEIPKIFDRIDDIFEESFLTNVILD